MILLVDALQLPEVEHGGDHQHVARVQRVEVPEQHPRVGVHQRRHVRHHHRRVTEPPQRACCHAYFIDIRRSTISQC